jgi:hypothetical protein
MVSLLILIYLNYRGESIIAFLNDYLTIDMISINASIHLSDIGPNAALVKIMKTVRVCVGYCFCKPCSTLMEPNDPFIATITEIFQLL